MTNCEWFESQLEAYFGDDLSEMDLRWCEQHLVSCSECRSKVDSLKGMEPLLRDVFQLRLQRAWSAQGERIWPRPFRLALAGTGLVVVAALIWGIAALRGPSATPRIADTPQAPPNIENTASNETKLEPSQAGRAKPEDGQPTTLNLEPNLDAAAPDGPEFAITDEAGYISTLDSYHGRFLLFGVVSPAIPRAVANLDALYREYGARPGIRILGVTSRREDALSDATFPRFFNHGSRLMGVEEGQFVLIDPNGKALLEGSLLEPDEVEKIRTVLKQSEIR